MRKFALLYVLPVLLLLTWKIFPLVTGSETLYLRDVMNTHLEMKAFQAQAMRQGRLPMLDLYRAGGQPLLGNPNGVPLYPDNLLYLVASTLWALNAHFWLHLLVAALALFWLARTLGLSREGAWAAAVCYSLSGYFLSHLSFYNLVAGVALTPALGAATLGLAARPAARSWVAVGLLWALLLVAGDPLVALLALALAGSLLLATGRWRGGLARLAGALACGTLVAAPQWVEFLRILPLSYRGHWGYSPLLGTVASWDPRQVAEWFLPFIFGRPDVLGAGQFWGYRFYTDTPPYYFSLYPGLLALALVAASGRPRDRLGWWAWGAVAAGLFLALGRFNPLVRGLFELLGAGALRYPVKFWLPLALGASILCGRGFDKAVLHRERMACRGLTLTLAGSSLLFALFWLSLNLWPRAFEGWLAGLLPEAYPPGFAINERLRWAGLCLFSLLLVGLLAVAWRSAKRWPQPGGAVLLALHAAAQLFFLSPLLPTDEVVPYLTPSPLLADVPADSALVHGAFRELFGSSTLQQGRFPGNRTYWLERRAFLELYPFAGAVWGRRYELNYSPEGLDSFLTRIAREAVKQASDAERLRLLEVWSVDLLLMDRPLSDRAAERAELVRSLPSFGHRIYLYRLPAAAPEVRLVGRVLYAPHVNAAVSMLKAPDFDPGTTVVLPGTQEALWREPGTVRILKREAERLEARVESGAGGVLVVDRAHLPLYRATVDGVAAPVEVANLHRLAVEVPAGDHLISLWVDRRPLRIASLGSLLGLAGLLVGAWLLGPRHASG
jgi:hypothetical protein